MKKLSIGMAFLLILSLLCSAASAEVITALATEVNPEHLEKTASYARILGYNEQNNTLTVQLIVPEIFSQEDVEALKVGDSIPVTLDMDEDRVLTGVVTSISGLGVTRQNAAYYQVHIRMEDPTLPLGASASVYIAR